MTAANATVQRAIAAAQNGDLAGSQREYKAYENTWFNIEEGVQSKSRDNYRAIEAAMSGVTVAYAAKPLDRAQVLSALTALDREQKNFVQGLPPSESTAAPSAPAPAAARAPSVATLLQQLSDARVALVRGDYVGAAAKIKEFQTTWLDVEGEIKTRSVPAYHDTEADAALAASLLSQRSPEAKSVLDRMYTRLEPYQHTTQYGVFDATVILLREGLEALLILVALLAFLKRSGNAERRGWVWSGAGAGLLLSLILGVALHLIMRRVINGGNRELIEGFTGLVAAGMLLYVSYWLHSQTNLQGWQQQIHEHTAAALTTGSLFGLALLSFLAVFREGAESVLFFLGMAANIAPSDLLLGLGIGAGLLTVLGVLIMVAGLRIPMRPFFAIAGLLVFYLCFKFLGTGIHALQVASMLPATGATYLPDSDTLGVFPTWQTIVPQVFLLALGAAVLLRDRIRRPLPSARSTAAVASK